MNERKSKWPKPEWFYITPDGMIQFCLICLLIGLAGLYVDKSLTLNRVLDLREDYDGTFCKIRAQVDTIQMYLGEGVAYGNQ